MDRSAAFTVNVGDCEMCSESSFTLSLALPTDSPSSLKQCNKPRLPHQELLNFHIFRNNKNAART